MHLDIFSDVICPWCYIGKKRLERALAARPQPDMTLRWRAFQLNPGMPVDGMDRKTYLAAKFGGGDRARQIYENIRQVGESEGITFNFEGIQRTPNTVDAHRLLHFAQEQGVGDAMAERLFAGYFLEGVDLGDHQSLAEQAAEVGLDKQESLDFLASEEAVENIKSESEAAYRMGVQGVPCFIVADRYAISGAQEPEGLYPLFDLARQKETEAAD